MCDIFSYNLNEFTGKNRFRINTTRLWNGQDIENECYSFFIIKNGKKEKHNFVLKKIKNDGLHIVLKDKSGKKPCIDIKFSSSKTTTNGHIGFNKSFINYINTALCGRNMNDKYTDEKVSGTYALKLALKLNDILDVKESTLEDDSRIDICDSNVSLKLLSIYKTSKTWYHRVGNFIPVDNGIYNSYEKSKNLTVNKLLEYTQKGDIFSRLSKKDLAELETLMKKIDMKYDAKIKDIILKGFSNKSPLSNCNKYRLYYLFFIKLSKPKEMNEEVKNFFNFSSYITNIMVSKKKY